MTQAFLFNQIKTKASFLCVGLDVDNFALSELFAMAIGPKLRIVKEQVYDMMPISFDQRDVRDAMCQAESYLNKAVGRCGTEQDLAGQRSAGCIGGRRRCGGVSGARWNSPDHCHDWVYSDNAACNVHYEGKAEGMGLWLEVNRCSLRSCLLALLMATVSVWLGQRQGRWMSA